MNASVLIGGIVGQNAAEGSISGISPMTNNQTIYITNSCKGPLGSYSVGGIAGMSSGYISDVIITNLVVNCTNSSGVTSYLGGMAGQLSVTDATNAELTSCNTGGSLRAGKSVPYGPVTSVSYLGGISGAVLNVPVRNCNTSTSLYGATETYPDVLYATGGVFGRIRTVSECRDIIAWGGTLAAPSNTEGITSYVGSFAGVAPFGVTEDDYSKNNINVNRFGDLIYIGTNLDAQNQPTD